LVGQGRLETLERWLKAVVAKSTHKNAWIDYWLAICKMPFDPAGAQSQFEKNYFDFKASGDVGGALASWCGIIKAILAQLGDFGQFDRWLQELTWELPQDLPQLPRDLELVVQDTVASVLAWRQPGQPRTDKWVHSVAPLKSRFEPQAQLFPLFVFETYYVWRGDIRGAQTALDNFRSAVGSMRNQPIIAGMLFFAEAMLGWVRGETAQTRSTIAQGLAFAQREGAHWWDLAVLSQSPYNELFAGNLPGARADLDRLPCPNHRSVGRSHYFYLESWYHLQRGEFSAALERALSYAQ
jgi:hypothetical protein